MLQGIELEMHVTITLFLFPLDFFSPENSWFDSACLLLLLHFSNKTHPIKLMVLTLYELKKKRQHSKKIFEIERWFCDNDGGVGKNHLKNALNWEQNIFRSKPI